MKNRPKSLTPERAMSLIPRHETNPEWLAKEEAGEPHRAHVERCPAGFWQTEPPVPCLDDGVSPGVDAIRCSGNAVVPDVAEWIGRRIIESIT